MSQQVSTRRAILSSVTILFTLFILQLFKNIPECEGSVIKTRNRSLKNIDSIQENNTVHGSFSTVLLRIHFPFISVHQGSNESSSVTLTPANEPSDPKEKKKEKTESPRSIVPVSDSEPDQQASTNTTTSPEASNSKDTTNTTTTNPESTPTPKSVPTNPSSSDAEPGKKSTPKDKAGKENTKPPVQLDEGKVPEEKDHPEKKQKINKPVSGFLPLVVGVGFVAALGLGYIAYQWIIGSRDVVEQTIANHDYQPVETDEGDGWNDDWADDDWDNSPTHVETKSFDGSQPSQV